MTVRAAHLFLIPVLALSLSACSRVNTWVRGEPLEKPVAAPAIQPLFKPKLLWAGSVGKADDLVFTPVIYNGRVYAAGAGGQIACFDAASGKQIWRVNTRENLSGGVGARDGLVLVGTVQGYVLAYDDNGKALWRAQLTSDVLSAPQTAGGVVVARSEDSRIFGLDAGTGKRKWVYQRSTPALLVRNFGGVALARGGVFAGFAGGKLVALDVENGGVGWEATVAQPKGVTELERIADITSLPLVDGGTVCAAAFQGRVACFDASRGSLIWEREISSGAGLAIDGGDLYLTDDKSAVHALEKASGQSQWKQDKLFARHLTAPLAVGAYVVVGDYEGLVHFIKREDGAFAARAATDGSAISSRPVAMEGGFLVQTSKGGVFAFAAP